MARKTKAQIAAEARAHLAAQHAPRADEWLADSAAEIARRSALAADGAPWAWPKSPAAIDGQQAACAAAREQAKAAAMAFFASRMAQQAGAAASEADPISDEDLAAQQAAAEKAFEAAIGKAMAEANAAAAGKARRPYIARSSIVRPTKAAWAIYDALFAHAAENDLPDPTRGECIAEAIRRGIASGTAATQFQYWKRACGR